MTNNDCEFVSWLSRFGLSSFRRGQEEVVHEVLNGSDVLCIMPTGGGKSLCYQLPSIAREGTTIVVSPLIALMKDQVDSLLGLGVPTTLINSSISAEEQRNRISRMRSGDYKLVYIAPERLRSSSFMRAIQGMSIQLLAIDEAHCISQWGHDFRPDYARLGRFRERLGNPQTIALTATATNLVREDICKILRLNEPVEFVSGFARENLSFNVENVSSNSLRDRRLLDFLNDCPGAGIVYASTRKNCEQIVELLNGSTDRQVEYYHAGLTPERRRQVQDGFMSGEIPIIVATNAFGMGIDKPDLRFVLHYNLPGSIEAYYQEAGRAGRDGKSSQCLLLYSHQDRFIQEFFIENSYPSRSIVKNVYDYLVSIEADPIEMTLMEIKEELGLSVGTEAISTCENLLEKAGVLERLDSQQNMAAVKIDSSLPSLIECLPKDAKSQRKVLRAIEKRVGNLRGERVYFSPQTLAAELEMKWDSVNRAIRQINRLEGFDYVPPFRGRALHLLDRSRKFGQLEIDFTELERRKKAEYSKLESMIRLASTRRCRQLEILEYFGDPDVHQCGRCDNCSHSSSQVGHREFSQWQLDACLYAIQVALSGAARTSGRVGKTLIAQMLAGSQSKKVKGQGLQRLSTFGLLSPLRQSDAGKLIDWLIDQGFLRQTENTKFRPVIQVTNRGKMMMFGEFANEAGLVSQLNSELVDSIAAALRGKKPRIPRSDSEDDRLDLGESSHSDERSQTVEFCDPTGKKDPSDQECDDREALDEGNATADSGQIQRLDSPSETPIRPSFYWTWKLMNDGYLADEIVQMRQIDRELMMEHLIQAAENSYESEAGWLLSDEQITELEKFLAENSSLDRATMISRLPSELSSQQLIYYLKTKATVTPGPGH